MKSKVRAVEIGRVIDVWHQQVVRLGKNIKRVKRRRFGKAGYIVDKQMAAEAGECLDSICGYAV